MTHSMGKCSVCGGDDARVVYPLLPGSPKFCDDHYNPKDAGPFGVDFSGPDDFDIPDGLETFLPFVPDVVDPVLRRDTFVWTDMSGQRHRLADINDGYLANIIKHLKKGKGHVRKSIGRDAVVAFLEGEAQYRLESGSR